MATQTRDKNKYMYVNHEEVDEGSSGRVYF